MILPRRDVPTSADVARHYDHLDRWYREIWGDHVHHGLWRTGRESPEDAARQLVREAADAAGIGPGPGPGPGDRVVDIGCGYGASAELLARERGARVTGVTISPVQHARAAARTAAPRIAVPGDGPLAEGALPDGAVTFLLRDWMDNGFPDGSFDAAIAIESFSHMPDKRRFLAEIRRVLRPGGRAALCIWAAAESPGSWEVRHLLEPICREGRLPGLATESEARAWMADAGFRQVEVRDLSRAVRRTWTVCATRGLRRWLTDAELRRFVLKSGSPERIYGLSIFRLWIGFRTGAMRYLLLSGRVNG